MCADQFPARPSFVRTKARIEILLGKQQNNGVLAAHGGYLISLPQTAAEQLSNARNNLNAVARFSGAMAQRDIPFVFAPVPRSIDVNKSRLPRLYSAVGADEDCRYLSQCANSLGLALHDLITPLRAAADSGQDVWYRTDHHWTSLGAYYAYAELGKHLGYSPFPLSEFTEEKVCGDFFGSSYSASLFPSATPDTVTAFRFEGDGEIKITDQNTGEVFGLYDENSLSSASKYDFFLGGNKAHLKIESGKKRRLVIVKDSFANSLVPFLSRHFDLEIIDPRYLRRPLSELLDSIYANGDAPALLLLFNPETLCTDAGIDNFG